MNYTKKERDIPFGEVHDEPAKKPLTSLQTVAAYLAPITAIGAVACVWSWAKSSDVEKKYLGGLAWTSEKAGNWHVVCMTGFFAFATLGMVAYRFLPLGKPRNKLLHGIWHVLGLICMATGLAAIFKTHNDGGYPNLWSLHSWVGLSAIVFYGQNYVLGALFFGTNLMNPNIKALYLNYHRVYGELAYIFVIAAVESGITELNAFNGCEYEPTHKDYNPAINYKNIPEGCRVSNGAGIFVIVTATLVFLALKNIYKEEKSHQHDPLLS